MARRVPSGSGLRPERFRPSASPVDRLRIPRKRNNISQLAQGLSQVSPLLSRLTEQAMDRKVEEDQLEGEAQARAWVEEGLTYKKAIEDGRITPDQSPWFRLGAKEFMGRNAASKYRDFLSARLAASPVAQSTEVDDFDEFERETRKEFLAEFVGEDNRDNVFDVAFGRATDGSVSGARASFVQAAGKRLVQNTAAEVQSSIMSTTLDAHTASASPEAAGRMVKLDIERAIHMGMTDKGKVNQMAAQAVIDAARRTNDLSLLEVLNHVETAPGNTLATVPGVTDVVEAAEREIRNELRIEEAAAEKAQKEEKEQTANALGTSLFTDLIQAENPLAVPRFTERIAEIAKYDLTLARSLNGARETVANQQTFSDPQLVEELIRGVYSGETTLQTVVDHLGYGLDPSGMGQVMNHLQMIRSTSRGNGQGGINDPAFNTDSYQQAERRLREELGGSTNPYAVVDENTKKKIQTATGHLRREWYRRYHQGGASEQDWMEQDQYLQPLVDSLVGSFSGGEVDPLTGDPKGLPEGPANPGDPRWKWQPMGTPEALTSLDSISSISQITPTQLSILNALEVEIIPGDDAQTIANIQEALIQQRFLYNLRTR